MVYRCLQKPLPPALQASIVICYHCARVLGPGDTQTTHVVDNRTHLSCIFCGSVIPRHAVTLNSSSLRHSTTYIPCYAKTMMCLALLTIGVISQELPTPSMMITHGTYSIVTMPTTHLKKRTPRQKQPSPDILQIVHPSPHSEPTTTAPWSPNDITVPTSVLGALEISPQPYTDPLHPPRSISASHTHHIVPNDRTSSDQLCPGTQTLTAVLKNEVIAVNDEDALSPEQHPSGVGPSTAEFRCQLA